MKKILVSMLLLTFFLVGAKVNAEQQVEKNGPKATNVKIHKKQVLSDTQRKELDMTKGNSAVGDKKVTLPASWATGIPVLLPEGGKRYAIVAGLGNYTGTINDLCVASAETSADYPENLALTDPKHYCQDTDSLNMQAALTGYKFDEIILLRDREATRENITSAMNSFLAEGKITLADEVVFFFSGHGVSGQITGDLEAVDEAIFTYDNNYIWDDELKAWADSLTDYRTVFVFDICLAGGMNDLAGSDRVVVMSSGEIQSSNTYTLGGAFIDGSFVYSEGLFSHYFVVKGIAGKLADGINAKKSKDGLVAVEESFGYTYPIIKKKQIPVLNDLVLNDLVP